jgi:pimeloyl-ACP methyl ester carboxylesterase
MWHFFSALTFMAGSLLGPSETFFVQVAPAPRTADEAIRTPGQRRAVVLIHGLKVHPFMHRNISKAMLHEWQKPGTMMVKRLALDSDVYSFAYSQDVAVEEVADGSGLAQCISRLHEMGYESIVLVGHSAGGLVARAFVEDVPNCGVTKVIQVCAPNGGSSWAEWKAVLPSQSAFLSSLTKETRKIILRGRTDRKIPKSIQFACVVANGVGSGDGFVLCRSAWTDDLQNQGIPAYPISTTHWQVPRIRPGVELIADLVRQDQPRWNTTAIMAIRRQLLKD